MADEIYTAFIDAKGDGLCNLNTDEIRALLLDNTYTPDASHSIYSDFSTHEISGTGYTASGEVLANQVWVPSGELMKFDADNPEWPSGEFTARFSALWNVTANVPMTLHDFGANYTVAGKTFSVEFNDAGIFVAQKGT